MKILILTVVLFTFAVSGFAQKASNDSMFWIREDGKYGYIDKTGKVVIAPQYENTMGFNEGVAATKLNGKYGYIDIKGKWVIKPQFEYTYMFSDGLAMVRTGKSYSWIDRKGNTVIQPSEFQEVCRGFTEGRCAVKRDGKWGYIDRTGKLVSEVKFKKASKFEGGLAQVETTDGMHHWITPNGRIVWSQNPGEIKKPHSSKDH
jgi:hypothetical protein